MNKGQLFLYTSLGIIVGGGIPTNVVCDTSDIDDKYQKTLLYIYSQQKDKLAVYSEVSQIVPKKDYRSRYASLTKSKSFADAYYGKSLGDFVKVEY